MASPRTRFCETDSGRARGATQLSQLEQHREHAFQFSVEMNLVAGEAFEPVRIRLRQMAERESMGGARVLAGDAEPVIASSLLVAPLHGGHVDGIPAPAMSSWLVASSLPVALTAASLD
jgi:hypothetical protein